MKTNRVRALLINDFDPAESKGAASVALDLASRIFEDKDFAYLCTSKQATSRQEFHNIRFEYLPETWIDQVRDKVRSYFPALEGLMRVLVIRRLWRIFWSAKKNSLQRLFGCIK